jgi:ribonuclease/clavin/mitogillin
MQFEPGIHQLTIGRQPFAGFPTPNSFMVVGKDSSILIDAGYDNEDDHRERMAYIESLGAPPVSELIITHRHPDHGGGAAAIHAATGAALTCHPLDREVIERDRLQGRAPIAADVHGGEVRDLGGLTVEIHHAPGHTPGCLALYVPERGALFATDTVMGMSTTVLRPPEGDLRAYANTLAHFQQIGAKTIYGGHGEPIADPAKRLDQLVRHREQREQDLLRVLGEGTYTVLEIREIMYTGLPEVRWALAEDQLRTGIAKLIEDGAAREEGDRYTLAR